MLWKSQKTWICSLMILRNGFLMPCPLDVSIKLKLREFFNEKNGMGLMAESILDMLFHETGIQPIVDKFNKCDERKDESAV